MTFVRFFQRDDRWPEQMPFLNPRDYDYVDEDAASEITPTDCRASVSAARKDVSICHSRARRRPGGWKLDSDRAYDEFRRSRLPWRQHGVIASDFLPVEHDADPSG